MVKKFCVFSVTYHKLSFLLIITDILQCDLNTLVYPLTVRELEYKHVITIVGVFEYNGVFNNICWTCLNTVVIMLIDMHQYEFTEQK